jgi:hypothetical protein
MTFNEWFMSLPEGRQKVLREDKWMLAAAAFEAAEALYSEEIERLRRVNSELGWQVSPDRMGGMGGPDRTDEWGNSY